MANNQTTVIISAKDETAAAFRSAQQSLKGFEGALGGLDAAFGKLPLLGTALATAFGAVSFTGVLKESISFAAALDDMSEKTGASVENLSALAHVAKISGTDLGVVEQSLIKLAKGLAGVGDESKGAARALKAIGLSQADLKGKDTAEALQIVAVALSKYEDGAGKTALAIDLLGKSGAQALPYLKDLAAQGELVAKVTAKQAADAERFEKALNKLKSEASDLGRSIALSIVPAMAKWAEQTNLASEKAGGLWETFKLFGTINPILRATGDNIRSLSKDLDDLYAKKAEYDPDGVLVAGDTEDSIARIQRKITIVKALQAQQALANAAALGDIRDARDRSISGPLPSLDYTGRDAKEKEAKAKKDDSREQAERRHAKDRADYFRRLRQEELDAFKAQQVGALAASASLAKLTDTFRDQNQAAADSMLVMPESQRRLAESLKSVQDSAAATRLELTRAFVDKKLTLADYTARFDELTRIEEEQVKKVRELAAEQDRLNASWEHGATRALTTYADFATNTALQVEQAMMHSFSAMEDSLVQFIMTGKLNFRSFANAVLSDLARIAIRQGITGPLAGALAGGFGNLFGNGNFTPGQGYMGGGGFAWNANGNAFGPGGLEKFANGGAFTNQIVSSPTLFKFANGTGLMGEAGPEAIMPLKRDGRGRLGVHATGGGGVVNNVSISVDASGGQVQGNGPAANDLGRRIEAAIRGVLVNEKRPGGLLAR